MLHQIGDLLSMSLDRKDSDIGYIVGNIQLVCQFANKAKGSSSDEAILAVFAAIRVQQRSPFLD